MESASTVPWRHRQTDRDKRDNPRCESGTDASNDHVPADCYCSEIYSALVLEKAVLLNDYES
jgi:hypothetical protein